MSFLTHVSLGTGVGFRNTTLTPSHTRAFYTRVLRREADSIYYIANHCPRLLSLEFSPHIGAIKECKKHHIEWVVKAVETVLQHCESLRKIEIRAMQHFQRCGCNTRGPHANPKNPKDVEIFETMDVTLSQEDLPISGE